MQPTICAYDFLGVSLYNNRKILCGDIVVFTSPLSRQKIVHRVISVAAGKIKTKGDNNYYIDPWLLSPSDIVGQVVYAQRGKRKIRIYGGIFGQICAERIKAFHFLRKSISFLFGAFYRYLAQKAILCRLSGYFIKPHIRVFNRPNGEELQLIFGNNFVVGRFMPGKGQWYIRRPFRLVLDKKFQ